MLYEKNPSEFNPVGLLRESIAVFRQQEAPHFGALVTKAERVLSQIEVTPVSGVASTNASVPRFLMEPSVEDLLHEVEAGLLAVPGAESLVSRVRQARTSLMASRSTLSAR
jgi:hypothetical protein